MIEVGPLQLEILNQLWAHGPQTVAQVHEKLNAGRTPALAYTTTLTVLRNLAKRELVTRRDVEDKRGHEYTVNVDKTTLQSRLVDRFLEAVFGGDKEQLRKLL